MGGRGSGGFCSGLNMFKPKAWRWSTGFPALEFDGGLYRKDRMEERFANSFSLGTLRG